MNVKATSLIRINGPCLRAFWGHGALLVLLWIVVYGGASWITRQRSSRVRLHLDAELRMPFLPDLAVVYLSLFPLLWLSPFVLRTSQELTMFAKALAWLILLSGVGFILLPGEQVRDPPTVDGAVGRIFRFADWLNLEHNYLPSLHVGMAVVCAYAYGRYLSVVARALVWIWVAAISISTLLTHQHYVADVVAGGLVGYVVVAKSFGHTAA